QRRCVGVADDGGAETGRELGGRDRDARVAGDLARLQRLERDRARPGRAQIVNGAVAGPTGRGDVAVSEPARAVQRHRHVTGGGRDRGAGPDVLFHRHREGVLDTDLVRAVPGDLDVRVDV